MTDTVNHVPPALAGTLRRQHQVITRRQALTGGMTRDMIKHRLRAGGPWQSLLPGVYLTLTGAATSEQREMAALLHGGQGSVITGVAALRRQGVNAPAGNVIDVLIPASRRRLSAGFARIVRTTRPPDRVVVISARHYAMPARAVADAARALTGLDEVRALVAAAVQGRHCPPALLADELTRGPVRGAARLRRALAEVADGIRSAAESGLRELIMRARIQPPMFNARLYDAAGAFIAVPDAWWPDAGVAAEVDSREWHLSPEDWQRTMARHAAMTACGILVLHFSPQQIRTRPQEVAATIEAALVTGRARPRLAVISRLAAA